MCEQKKNDNCLERGLLESCCLISDLQKQFIMLSIDEDDDDDVLPWREIHSVNLKINWIRANVSLFVTISVNMLMHNSFVIYGTEREKK